MNPQMKIRLDLVCKDAAEKFSTTPEVVQLYISCNLLATKLLVIGDNANDKKMDIRATMRQCAEEITHLLLLTGPLYTPIWDAKKVIEVYNYVGEKVLPIVKFFYFGVAEEDRKDEAGKIIVPN